MNVSDFQNMFFYSNVKVRNKIFVVLFFIVILLFTVVNNNNFYSYYSGSGVVKNGQFNILVNVKDLDKILNNNKIIIERTTFTYDVYSLSENNLEYGTDIFRTVLLNIDLPEHYNIENNYVDYKIITGKDTIMNYVFNTIFKGE